MSDNKDIQIEHTMQVPMKDIKNILGLFIKIGNAYNKSMEDGKFSLTSDFIHFIPVALQVGPFITSIQNIRIEFLVPTENEKNEIIGWVKDELTLSDKQAEAFIEDAFKQLMELYGFIRTYFFKPQTDSSPDSGSMA